MPNEGQFNESLDYYACILHELSHWTGHGTRLDRKAGMQGAFGSDAYAQEELRAEMAAMMLGIRLGVGHNPKHSASYIDGYLGPRGSRTGPKKSCAPPRQPGRSWICCGNSAGCRRTSWNLRSDPPPRRSP